MSAAEKKIRELYDAALKRAEAMVSDETTYLEDLTRAGRRLFGVKYKGTFPSDKIPRLNDLSPFCILNLDKSNESGSHWVALAKLPLSKNSIFYDSFGRHSTKILPSLKYSGNGMILHTDDDAEQHPLETNCGARCLAFLMVLESCGSAVALRV